MILKMKHPRQMCGLRHIFKRKRAHWQICDKRLTKTESNQALFLAFWKRTDGEDVYGEFRIDASRARSTPTEDYQDVDDDQMPLLRWTDRLNVEIIELMLKKKRLFH